MTAETVTIPHHAPPAPAADIGTLLTGSGLAMLSDVAFIRVSGEDRTRWLNGMVTNSIVSLKKDEASYNFFLNAQGRIQGDAIALNAGDSLQLVTSASRADSLIALLDHFIIMDDVELHRLSDGICSLLIAGPQSASFLRSVGLHVDDLAPMHAAHFDVIAANRVTVFHAYSPVVPRFELWSDRETLGRIASQLQSAGVLEASEETLLQLRLLEGTPLYGVDIRDRDLPQETAQTRALHFAKGCYLGQEIVERIRSRGNVHRTLQGFTLTGALPTLPAPLFSSAESEKPIGELTSAAEVPLPTGPAILALGTIRREVLEKGIRIQYEGGTAAPAALPNQP